MHVRLAPDSGCIQVCECPMASGCGLPPHIYIPDDVFRAFLEHHVTDLTRFNLGLVVKKAEYFPCIMDVDNSATKGTSVGSPMEVLKVVVRALKSVVSFPDGEGSALRCAASGGLERSSKEIRMLFEHCNNANFHVLCPNIIADSRTAVRIREKQLAILTSGYLEVDCNDIVDERVLTLNGLRLLGSLMYKEISSARDRTKRYDVAGGRYVPVPDRPGECWRAHNIQGGERKPAAQTRMECGRPVRAALRGLHCDVHM